LVWQLIEETPEQKVDTQREVGGDVRKPRGDGRTRAIQIGEKKKKNTKTKEEKRKKHKQDHSVSQHP
jgi:hypothetical protein